MKTSFTNNFNKQVSKIKDKSLALAIINIIEEVEAANTPDNIPNLKKLKGHKTAYRIRNGSYRLGLFIENSIVTFAAFAHRKDIYIHFP